MIFSGPSVLLLTQEDFFMLRIAICDDSEASRKDVVNHLMDYSVKNNFDYTVDEYGSGDIC